MLKETYKKSDIKTGDVLMVSSSSWLSRQIQKITKSKWNHAGIFVWIWGELFIIEAERRGIQITKWTDKKYDGGNSTKRKLMRMSPKKRLNQKEVATFMLPMCGTKPYDFMSLLLYQVIYNLTGKWIGRTREKAKGRFYCSEFTAYVYNHFLGYFDNEWWKTSPKMLVRDEYFNMYPINFE